MVIQVTTRQLFQMLKEAYMARARTVCVGCGTAHLSEKHEVEGLAEQTAERIVMKNLRDNDFIVQQS